MLSRGQRAARALDGFAGLRDVLHEVAQKRGDWAGIPMPLDDQRLVVESSYPNAEALMKIGEKPVERDPRLDGWTIRNEWYSRKHRCDIHLIERDGKVRWGMIPAVHHFTHDLQTLGCSQAWGLEQEQRALQLLGTMLRHHQMRQYILTGMFLEGSRRSGVTYMFRRLKPTVAMVADRKTDQMRILAALCMHPIAYYAGSWAGAMCPTDDVIAHLALMRGDEHMFWKRCNQHASHRPEAGL